MFPIDGNDLVSRKSVLQTPIEFDHHVTPREGKADLKTKRQGIRDHPITDFGLARTANGIDKGIDAMDEVADDLL